MKKNTVLKHHPVRKAWLVTGKRMGGAAVKYTLHQQPKCWGVAIVLWAALTLPLLCKMVVRVLHTRSLLTMSRVTSTSASTKLLCFSVMSSSRSVLIVERFLAMILALMAAIFSTDMASESELRERQGYRKHDGNGNCSYVFGYKVSYSTAPLKPCLLIGR